MRRKALGCRIEEECSDAIADDRALRVEHVCNTRLRRGDGQNPEALPTPLGAMPVLVPAVEITCQLASKRRFCREANFSIAARGNCLRPQVDFDTEIVTVVVQDEREEAMLIGLWSS